MKMAVVLTVLIKRIAIVTFTRIYWINLQTKHWSVNFGLVETKTTKHCPARCKQIYVNRQLVGAP